MTLGEKLQKLRKQSGLSQEALAEKLTVTRQTISKWELDQSTPDLTFLTQLCDLFAVSADYLIREESVEPDAQPMRRKKVFRFTETVKRRILILLSTAAIIAVFVCLICDYFTLGCLSWALVTAISIAAGWCLCVPVLTARGKIVQKTLLTASVILIPYLALLGFLLKNQILFQLGACVSLVSLAAVWAIYGIFRKCRSRLWRAFGFTFLVMIPTAILDHHIAAAFILQDDFDRTSDLFHSIITFLLAAACFVMDFLRSHNKELS